MIRSQRITSAAVTLQRMVRGFVYRRVFFATRNALLLIQRMSRGMIVSRVALHSLPLDVIVAVVVGGFA